MLRPTSSAAAFKKRRSGSPEGEAGVPTARKTISDLLTASEVEVVNWSRCLEPLASQGISAQAHK